MTCGACFGDFSTKETIFVDATHGDTLGFHTTTHAPVCDDCAEKHAPEQMAVLQQITTDAIERDKAERETREAERRRIRACVKPGDVAAAAAKLLVLGIDLQDRAAAAAALKPAYEEEAVREFYISKCLATALTAGDPNEQYFPF
jgi:hypothetical protein